MSFPAGHAANLFLIEVLRADVGGAGQAEFEILLEEEVVGGCAFILDVVLQVASGLHPRKAKPLHDRHDLIVDRDLLKPHVDAEGVHSCETDKPRMFSNIDQTQSIFRFDVDEPAEEVFELGRYFFVDEVKAALDLAV